MYSSLDTHCTGIGDGKIEVSAGATCFSSLGESMDVLRLMNGWLAQPLARRHAVC
jgi:hypothetical protein